MERFKAFYQTSSVIPLFANYLFQDVELDYVLPPTVHSDFSRKKYLRDIGS